MKTLNTTLLFVMLAGIAITMPVSAAPQDAKQSVSKSSAAYTPVKGSAERAAIMDALRTEIKKMSDYDVIFRVSHLKLKNNWAWVVAEPQSRDGTQNYESMIGLLQKKNGRWVYVEGPPEAVTCDEDPECADSARYYRKLAKTYPGVSLDIFPK